MNIVVAIKQVPVNNNITLDPTTNNLQRSSTDSILNLYDLYAIGLSINLKNKYGGKVTVITMGPDKAKEALYEALSYGVDDAILLNCKAFAGSDTLMTALTLSKGIQEIFLDTAFDLILTGKQSSDGDTGQVGPSLAEYLKIPSITNVSSIREITNKHIFLTKKADYSSMELKVEYPVLLSCLKDLGEPKTPSIMDKIKAKNHDIRIFNSHDLKLEKTSIGLKGSPTSVIKVFKPPINSKCVYHKKEDNYTSILTKIW